MPTYGTYDPVKPLHHSALGTVTIARGPQSEQLRVVKVYNPPRAVWDATTVERARERFLASARVQKQVADSGAAHWRPVEVFGSTGDESYYVGAYYRWSARAAIAGQLRPDALGLHAIVEGIFTGLTELKRVCGRTHGNLKSSNVLVDRRSRTEWDVFLTDPAADVAAVPPAAAGAGDEAGEARDLLALAHLIIEFVTSRPLSSNDNSIPKTQDWSRLGRRLGESWRELCQALLDRHSTTASRGPYDTFRKDLDSLKPVDWVPAARWGAGVGTAAAATVVSVGLIHNAGFTLPWNRPTPPGPGIVVTPTPPPVVIAIDPIVVPPKIVTPTPPVIRILTPNVRSAHLGNAWKGLVARYPTATTDPKIAERLDTLRLQLEQLELRDLPDPTGLIDPDLNVAAAAERERLLKLAAEAVGGADPFAGMSREFVGALRDEYQGWIKDKTNALRFARKVDATLAKALAERAQGADGAALSTIGSIGAAADKRLEALEKEILTGLAGMLAEAQSARAAGDLAGAAARLDALLGRDPGHAAAKQLRDTVTSETAVLAKKQVEAAGYVRSAEASAKAGQLRAALQSYDLATQVYPQHPQVGQLRQALQARIATTAADALARAAAQQAKPRLADWDAGLEILKDLDANVMPEDARAGALRQSLERLVTERRATLGELTRAAQDASRRSDLAAEADAYRKLLELEPDQAAVRDQLAAAQKKLDQMAADVLAARKAVEKAAAEKAAAELQARLVAEAAAAKAAEAFRLGVRQLSDAANGLVNGGNPGEALTRIDSIAEPQLRSALGDLRTQIEQLIAQAPAARAQGDAARSRNPADALAAYERSARGGDPQGMLRLAQMYQAGEGVAAADPAAAAKWFRQSAKLRNVDAMIELASMLEKGTGVERADPAEARTWRDQAFSLTWGVARGGGNTGGRAEALYNSGYGSEQDRKEYFDRVVEPRLAAERAREAERVAAADRKAAAAAAAAETARQAQLEDDRRRVEREQAAAAAKKPDDDEERRRAEARRAAEAAAAAERLRKIKEGMKKN